MEEKMNELFNRLTGILLKRVIFKPRTSVLTAKEQS